MKHYILPLIPMLILLGNAFGQSTEQLPNPGFENWVQRSTQTYVEPTSWYSLNMLKQYGYPATTINTTDAHSGTAAVRLETKSGPTSDIPGLLCSAYMFDANEQPDFDLNLVPFHSRPLSVSFWYKCTQVANDTNVFQMLLTKWNSAKGTYDTIGEAHWSSQQTVSNYTQATCAFTYYSAATPDSASVLFSTTVLPFTPVIGNVLIVDDITLNYPAVSTGKTLAEKPGTEIYPNPVTAQLHIRAAEEVNEAIMLDAQGKQLLTFVSPGTSFTMDCATLNSGLYFLHLRLRSGKVETKRFTK